MGDYHKLEVWKLSCALADEIAIVVDEEVPGGRAGAMGDQLSRSADSIPRNIAEGCGYDSDRQLVKYLRQSLGSTDEVQNDLEALQRRRLLSEARVHLIADAKLIAKKLHCFIDRVAGDG